ncbi:transglutaminase domain-containing protein [Methylovulum psychrotolerans]|uniref:transglutaminase-like domain-containing protein n=1 Tax=Methylovulum psychrotolerans TaxID=1704499 RepID=UPI001BFF0992|nr:transglutaminase-like domain-containing protein [Methylovulum psychrotolerans]MBT9096835.1 transglutaminase domain-containing protein [Methylovulum psychrotolerans]
MSGTRTLSAMTLFFFVWMTLYPAMAAAVAAVPAPSVTPAVAQPAPDTLESLRGLSQRAHAKTEAGEDSGTEVKQLLQHAAQLDGEQQRAEAGFAADRQHLEERHLPDIIRECHAQALADYRANMQQLRQQLTDFKAAHDRKDAAAARRHLKSLAQFLDNAQKHRQHLPFDADNLPSVIPNRKTRAPKTSRRDLDGILHPPKPVAVAANELTPGMLATDDPGPTPTAADLAATEDAPLSAAVKAQAAALHNNPVAIYNWVRNTVEFQPTYGGIQNADQTLQTRRGNATDTASLLVALLRAANIPARYAYGTVQIPAAQVMNWVGSVGTPEAAQSLLNQGGIPNSAVVSGGVITAFKLEHVWVEAFVDYFPSRGAVNKVGDTWVPLDASFKQRGDQNGLDLTAAVPLNAQAVTDTAKAAAQCGADSAQALDSAPVADYSLRLNRYLAAQSPDLSLTDILGTHTITTARYPILLGSLPYATVSQATVTATYPDSLRWRLRYAVYASELERGQNRPALILDNSLAALGGQRVTLHPRHYRRPKRLGQLYARTPTVAPLRRPNSPSACPAT